MNTISKISVAGALAMGYVSAHAAITVPTSSGPPTNVLLFAEVLNSSGAVVGSYAGDTGVLVSTAASGNVAPGLALSAASDHNLQSLLTLGATSGDTIEWAVQGGQWQPSPSSTNFGPPGAAQFLTTVTGPQQLAQLQGRNETNLIQWANVLTQTVTKINANSGGANSVFGTTPAGAGLWDTTVLTANIQNWQINGTLTAQTGLGTSGTALYYVTGGGSNVTPVSVAQEGTVSLQADGLHFNAPAAVPLPAAIWLLGSGLLGLFGVGRRKSTQSVAAIAA